MANTAINIFGNSGEAMVGVDTLNDIIAGKQATLVSGTNIKTVNGNTLLGSGDVELTASDVGALPDNTVIPTGIEAADPADGTWTINLSNGNTITMDLNHTHPQYQPLLTAGTNISIAEDNQTGDLVISATGGGSSGNVGNLNTNNTSALTVSSSESFSGNISLHKISKTGSYNDLNNQPTIPSASTVTPIMDGTAAIGSSTQYAKADHVHPSDTSKMSTSHPANAITSAKISQWDNKQSQHRELGEFIQTYLENLPTSPEDARALTQEELASLATISANDIWTLSNYPCGFDWDLLQNSGYYSWSANIGSGVWEYQVMNDSGLYWTQFSIKTLQSELVSGTNIKTINNQSLLGSGNLTPSDIGAITRFVVDFTLSGTTISNPNKTFSEIKAAYDAGNLVLARDNIGSLYYLLYCEDTSCGFFCSDSGMLYTIDVDSSDAWTYQDTSISQLELELSDKSQIIYMQKINNDWKKLTYNSLTGTWSVNNTTLTGNIKNIYLDKDNNDLYYWDGSEFVLIDEDNVQPDWNQSDSSKADYIKNKPVIPNSIKVGSVAGKLYRSNVGGSGNFTVSGNSGCIPNLTAGTFLVSIYAKSDTQSYTFRFNFGSSVTYDLSTTNGEINDVRQITIPSNGTFSGLVLNSSVASGTILYVVMYNYLTPVSTVGIAAVTNRYADLDGTPTIPTVPSAYTSNPSMNGTASAGSSSNWSRGDHVHPKDTSKADVLTLVTVSTSGAVTQALDANKFYKFTASLTSLTLTLNAAANGLAIYAGRFIAGADDMPISLPSGTIIPDNAVAIKSGNTYEFNIMDNVCLIVDVTAS